MGYENAIRVQPKGWFKSIVGERSGKLLANEYYGYEPGRHGPIHYYRCKCDCGGEAIISRSNFVRRASGSCGCLKAEALRTRSKTHGMRKTSEYNCWVNIRARCGNPKNKRFKDYGGRGIKVCERWRASFENFIADMGRKPSAKHSIEREDVNGDYEPGNCKWVLVDEQVRNKRSNHRIIYRGKEMILADAIRLAGMTKKAVSNRLSRGWSIERALNTPLNAPRKVRTRPNGIWVEVEGERMLLRAACTKLSKKYQTVYARIKCRGWSVEDALAL